MHLLKRLTITLVAVFTAAFVSHWLSTEVVILWEMNATGALTRADLGDDLGLGILFFLFALPATCVATLWAGIYAWGRSGRAT